MLALRPRVSSLRITRQAASSADMFAPSSPAQFRISATSASVTVSPIACRYWAETIFKASLMGDLDPESICDSQNILISIPAAQSGFSLVPDASLEIGRAHV